MCQKSIRYNWAGDIIRRDTIIDNKRAVLGYPDTFIPTDIRQWIRPQRNERIKIALDSILALPSMTDRTEGSFNLRALVIWNYVINHTDYIHDKEAQGMPDFWQFPEETLQIDKGDCEDLTFLLVSLLLASGVSPFCVRACIGTIYQKGKDIGGHAWPVYLDEAGKWRLLEATLNKIQEKMPLADPLTKKGLKFQYVPEFVLNQYHLWQVKPSRINLEAQLKKRKVNMRR